MPRFIRDLLRGYVNAHNNTPKKSPAAHTKKHTDVMLRLEGNYLQIIRAIMPVEYVNIYDPKDTVKTSEVGKQLNKDLPRTSIILNTDKASDDEALKQGTAIASSLRDNFRDRELDYPQGLLDGGLVVDIYNNIVINLCEQLNTTPDKIRSFDKTLFIDKDGNKCGFAAIRLDQVYNGISAETYLLIQGVDEKPENRRVVVYIPESFSTYLNLQLSLQSEIIVSRLPLDDWQSQLFSDLSNCHFGNGLKKAWDNHKGYEPETLRIDTSGTEVQHTHGNFPAPLHVSKTAQYNISQPKKITEMRKKANDEVLTILAMARSLWAKENHNNNQHIEIIVQNALEAVINYYIKAIEDFKLDVNSHRKKSLSLNTLLIQRSGLIKELHNLSQEFKQELSSEELFEIMGKLHSLFTNQSINEPMLNAILSSGTESSQLLNNFYKEINNSATDKNTSTQTDPIEEVVSEFQILIRK